MCFDGKKVPEEESKRGGGGGEEGWELDGQSLFGLFADRWTSHEAIIVVFFMQSDSLDNFVYFDTRPRHEESLDYFASFIFGLPANIVRSTGRHSRRN